jgi:uncharacterized membrane protein YgcG
MLAVLLAAAQAAPASAGLASAGLASAAREDLWGVEISAEAWCDDIWNLTNTVVWRVRNTNTYPVTVTYDYPVQPPVAPTPPEFYGRSLAPGETVQATTPGVPWAARYVSMVLKIFGDPTPQTTEERTSDGTATEDCIAYRPTVSYAAGCGTVRAGVSLTPEARRSVAIRLIADNFGGGNPPFTDYQPILVLAPGDRVVADVPVSRDNATLYAALANNVQQYIVFPEFAYDRTTMCGPTAPPTGADSGAMSGGGGTSGGGSSGGGRSGVGTSGGAGAGEGDGSAASPTVGPSEGGPSPTSADSSATVGRSGPGPATTVPVAASSGGNSAWMTAAVGSTALVGLLVTISVLVWRRTRRPEDAA